MKNPIVKKFRIKTLILKLFFQSFKAKKSFKIQDLKNKPFYYNKPFIQSEKNGKILTKKSQKKKKE